MNNLPKELIQYISSYLERNSVAALCLTSKSCYKVFLPVLYRHIILDHRLYMKQLEQGLNNNEYLRKTASENTQKITIKCQQGGSDHRWRLIFRHLPHVQQLNFRDYMELAVYKIEQMLMTLPQVSRLDIRYCNLIDNDDPTNRSSCKFPQITELQMMWTDFTLTAIQNLFQTIPNIHSVSLGANHNRRPTENDTALLLLQQSCFYIQNLSISLQQVTESSLGRVLENYGIQLEKLSLRCEGDQILRDISNHAKKLQRLVIRHSGCTHNDVTNILRECDSLDHLELVSWPVRDVPNIMLDRIKSIHDVGGLKKTFALRKSDLQEIREVL